MTAEPDAAAARIARLDAVVEALSEHPDEAVRAGVAELVGALQWLHAEGLARLVELVAERPELFRRAMDDPRVANLLLLHDLVVVDERDRALEALDAVRPLLRGHGGEVELVSVEEGLVRLRLAGACDGCPSSSATVRLVLERALAERLPGFRAVELVDGAPDAAGAPPEALEGPGRRREREARGEPVSRVPPERLAELERRLARGATAERGSAGDAAPREAAAVALDALPDGVHGLLVGNDPVLVVRDGASVRAFRNACPGSLLPLHLGRVEGGALVCPWHGCRFDLATGAREGAPGPGLAPLAARVVDGAVQVRP